MSAHTKTVETLEQSLDTLQNLQDATFSVANAVAERTPGVPELIASSVNKSQSTFVNLWFGAAERALTTEKRTAEQVLSLTGVLLAKRSDDVEETVA